MIVVHNNALIITFDRQLDNEFNDQAKQFFVSAIEAMAASDCDYSHEIYIASQIISSALDLGQFDKNVHKSPLGGCISVLRLLNLAPTFAPLVQPSI
jgi:hypothetical protein